MSTSPKEENIYKEIEKLVSEDREFWSDLTPKESIKKHFSIE